MTRREFIKALLASASITGIYPTLSYATSLNLGKKYINGATPIVTGCMWCQAGCTMIVYIKNGRIVHITGNPDDPVTKGKICIKPLGTLDILNSHKRLKYPLKRIGNKFVKLSWEEALDEISYKLKKIKEKYGPESLGIWASGRSAFDGRLVSKAFSKLYGTLNWEKTGPFCNYSAKIAGITTTGTRHVPWIYEDGDFYSADLYIFLGSNMPATRPPIFINLKEEKQKRGCKFICINPKKSEIVDKTDWWIPIRPGTDMALALGMIHYIISNGLEDKRFINAHTKGFKRFKEEVLKYNYNIKWASKITDIPEKDIKRLVHEYISTPKAIIIANTGISHHTNAVQTHRAFYFLTAITGHFGYPATGYGCLNNGGSKIGSFPLPKDRLPKPKASLGKNPVRWLESIEDDSYPYKLHALISTGSPITQWPEQEKIRYLIKKLDLSVWNGIVPSVNIYHFKYILPAATWIEAGGIAPVSDDSRFALVPKLIDPPGEAKPDRWWWIKLGQKMGWKDIFRDELTDYQKLIDYCCSRFGFSIKDFLADKNHAIRAPKGRKTLFLNGKFKTKSEKFLFVDDERKFSAYGLTCFPKFYLDPDLAKKGEETISYKKELVLSPFQKNKCYTKPVTISKRHSQNDFTLNLITGRPGPSIMGDATHWSKLLSDLAPNQVCIIHPETAKKYGINHSGKNIHIISPYGKTTSVTLISKNIKKDTVFVPYSYGVKEPFSHWKSINFVTNQNALCPISGQVAFKGIKVDIKTL